MSLDLVKRIFKKLPDCEEWHAHLLSLRIQNARARHITVEE